MPRRWTDEQRKEKGEAVALYWKTYGHPSQGRRHSESTIKAMKKGKKRSSIKGHCQLCGRALYNAESAQRGLGPGCAGLSSS